MTGPLVGVDVDGDVAHLRLSDPHTRNAVGRETAHQALAALDSLRGAGARVGLLSAESPVFCAGNDLAELGSSLDTADFAITRLIHGLLDSPIFWIAAVDGPALGGGMALLAVCPMVILSHNAWFLLPEAQHGLFPAGVAPYLEVVLGTRPTLDLGVTGRRLNAADAVDAGLAREVVASDQLERHACELAASLAQRPPVVDAAREAWQAQFTTESFVSRRAMFERIFRQSQEPQSGAVTPDRSSG